MTTPEPRICERPGCDVPVLPWLSKEYCSVRCQTMNTQLGRRLASTGVDQDASAQLRRVVFLSNHGETDLTEHVAAVKLDADSPRVFTAEQEPPADVHRVRDERSGDEAARLDDRWVWVRLNGRDLPNARARYSWKSLCAQADARLVEVPVDVHVAVVGRTVGFDEPARPGWLRRLIERLLG
ncbi:hypothetical protein [Prauserella muralis]|uniref:Uncharacterized protein n=1 Tax=Prauserella muralis TaxID=588067 RepID=A0A2V4ALN0_9PSEU|nr:hypothetical protein [Prauserella muralis]PXY21142.1 hypothetical protein BAY60_27125 [Prauserella muralis]TWE30230.1 hypothetical protein FHX69_2927 [Prauserella muralis]